jgi:hypothetical protein
LKRLHNEVLVCFAKNYLGDQIKEDDTGEAYSTHGSEAKCVKILVGKSEGKRALARPRCRWEDNIRMDLRKIMWESVDWIHVAQELL